MNASAPTAGRKAVVIGGGVIGAASAHHLSKRGWDVTVLDASTFAGACSHGNCGLVCPSHVLPLSEPGAVRKALRVSRDDHSAMEKLGKWMR